MEFLDPKGCSLGIGRTVSNETTFARPFRYDIMTKCWKDDPNLRPSFEKLRNKLKEMGNRHKVELKILRRVSLCFFFPFQSLIVRIHKPST